MKKLAIMDPVTGEMFSLRVGAYDHKLKTLIHEDGSQATFIRQKKITDASGLEVEVNVFLDDAQQEFYVVGEVTGEFAQKRKEN